MGFGNVLGGSGVGLVFNNSNFDFISDIINLDYGFSICRKLSKDYTGNIFSVRRSSDNSIQDIGFLNNEVDLDALATFCGSGDGYVVKIYDQFGNGGSLFQNIQSRQMPVYLSGTNILQDGKLAMTGINNPSVSGLKFYTFFGSSASEPIVFSDIQHYLGIVGRFVDIGNSETYVFGSQDFIVKYNFDNNQFFFGVQFDISTPLFSNNTFVQVNNDGIQNSVYSGNVFVGSSTPDIENFSISKAFNSFSSATSNSFSGFFQELLIHKSTLSSSERTAVANNVINFYGIV